MTGTVDRSPSGITSDKIPAPRLIEAPLARSVVVHMHPHSRVALQPARNVLLGAAVLGVALLGTGVAHAGSFEQISRAGGAGGAALFSNQALPVFASDAGTSGMVMQDSAALKAEQRTLVRTIEREIVANSTRTVLPGPGRELVHGLTADETTMLISRPAGLVQHYALRPVDGGADVPVTDATGYSDFDHSGAISADGSTVVVTSEDPGGRDIRVVDVASGSVAQYDVTGTSDLDAYSVSADGSVIAGSTPRSPAWDGFVIAGGTVTRLKDSSASVSPDGSTVVEWPYVWSGTTVTIRQVAGGSTRTFPVPAGGVRKPIWIARDGSRVAFAAPDGGQSMQLNTATGVWSKFGRQFSGSLTDTARVSRSGRYAVVEYAKTEHPRWGYSVGQAALVDLTGGELAGAQEALSASSYLRVMPPVASCPSPGTITGGFGRPAPWAPLPRKGELTITVDGTQTFRQTYTAPTDAISIPFDSAAQSMTIKAKVTDYLGRTLTTEQTIAVRCLRDEQ